MATMYDRQWKRGLSCHANYLPHFFLLSNKLGTGNLVVQTECNCKLWLFGDQEQAPSWLKKDFKNSNEKAKTL